MKLIADLHIHSRFSRATSKDLNLENLEKNANLKGLDLLGTGDFTHPKWIKELKENLFEDETGILKTKTGFNFLLQSEISLMYSQDGKGRRVHNLVLAPNFEIVDQITEYLLTKGRVDYDGRPIFKIPCDEFVYELRKISNDVEVIPAHIWTPWFGMLGSKSGFDSVKECFLDQTKNIHAIETGLSSDPPMNWRLSSLDKFNLLSFSDIHSFWPWRLGREATIFDIKPSYKHILNAIRTGKGLFGTVEVNPNYGIYHHDGHRACNVVMFPKESIKHNNICPVCKKGLTLGVQHRVEELADRNAGCVLKNSKNFFEMMPLSEVLSAGLGKGVNTQAVWKEYNNLVEGVNEFDVLMNMSKEELKKRTKYFELILKNRKNELKVSPGYDGVYGTIDLN